MQIIKKWAFVTSLLVFGGMAYANNCDASRTITVSVTDNLNEIQVSEQIELKFATGQTVHFNVNKDTPTQTHQVTLPVCDAYTYTTKGEVQFVKKNKVWKGAHKYIYAKRNIQLADGDKLAMFGNLDDSSVDTIEVYLDRD